MNFSATNTYYLHSRHGSIGSPFVRSVRHSNGFLATNALLQFSNQEIHKALAAAAELMQLSADQLDIVDGRHCPSRWQHRPVHDACRDRESARAGKQSGSARTNLACSPKHRSNPSI